MSNINAPFGLRPQYTLSGAEYDHVEMTVFLAAATPDVFLGQPLKMSGSANTTDVKSTSGLFKAGQLMEAIPLAAADDFIDFVVTSVEADVVDENLKAIYSKTGKDRVVKVVSTVNCIFEAQAAGIIAAGDVGAIFGVDSTVAGDTVSGFSGVQIGAPTAGAALQVVGLSFDLNNSDIASANANWLVTVVKRQLGDAGGA